MCVCCLVMMMKHAGRKYSIPTKPKKASKQTAAGRSAAVRRRVTAFLEKRAQPLLTADYSQVSSPAQRLFETCLFLDTAAGQHSSAWLCSFFQESGNAAFLPAVCLLAFFGFVGILYFLPACLIIITRQHTHTQVSNNHHLSTVATVPCQTRAAAASTTTTYNNSSK